MSMDPNRASIECRPGEEHRRVCGGECVVALHRDEPPGQVLVLLLMHEGPGDHKGMQGEEQHHIANGWVEAAQESSVLQLLVDVLKTGVEGLMSRAAEEVCGEVGEPGVC